MNLEQLNSFSHVVKAGSITKAAKKLHVSQPALSLQIQDLEKYFNANLLNRTNRGVSPTPIGEIVFEYSQKVLQMTDSLTKEISALQNQESQDLKVGTSDALGEFALPCSIYIFKEKYPKHNVYLDICNTQCVIDKVIEGSLPMGVIEGVLDNELMKKIKAEGLSIKQLGNDKLIVIAPYNLEWKTKESISFEDLRNHKLILQQEGSGVLFTLFNTFNKYRKSLSELNVVLKLSSISAIVSSVTADHGISILPKMALRKELRHRTLKAVNITDIDLVHPLYLIYNPKKIQNNLGSLFLDFILSSERGFC